MTCHLSLRPAVDQHRRCKAVEARLLEALQTLSRVPDPAPGPRGEAAAWPDVARDWWQAYGSDEEMLRFAANAVRITPSPDEIDRMMPALEWLVWLTKEQQITAAMLAYWPRPASWRKIGRKIGADHKTAKKRWFLGLMTIEQRLQQAGAEIFV